jgi:hypothetical protein
MRLYFDLVHERFINSTAVNALLRQALKPAYRKGYRIPESV